MSTHLPKRGDIAQYQFSFGDIVVGEVIAVGQTYADVRWSGARVERIRFRHPDGVTFKPADTN